MKSVLSKSIRLFKDFNEKYGNKFSVVLEYFQYKRSSVELIDLRDIANELWR